MTRIINGKELSLKIKDEVKAQVEEFKSKYNRDITLAVILVGEDPASKVYVNNKIKGCEYVGIKSLSFKLDSSSEQKDVEELIKSLAINPNVDGILVQLPLPKHLVQSEILNLIPASKDVDGFLAENIGNLALGNESTVACTPFGVLEMLKSTGENLSGKKAVVLGRSNIVGKPMAMLLLNENCTVTVCHSKTLNLEDECKRADIIIAAIGKANFVKDYMVKDGAIVIDVGINRTENGLVGDVDYENVAKKASFITPVPGGVGPMTIAMLLKNTFLCALRRENC